MVRKTYVLRHSHDVEIDKLLTKDRPSHKDLSDAYDAIQEHKDTETEVPPEYETKKLELTDMDKSGKPYARHHGRFIRESSVVDGYNELPEDFERHLPVEWRRDLRPKRRHYFKDDRPRRKHGR